jgi:hypothetical protein
MTIDERLEALTHSVELIAQMQQTTEKELRRLSRDVRGFMRTAQLILLDHETRLRQIEGDEQDENESNSP